jgi:hypothetical protein
MFLQPKTKAGRGLVSPRPRHCLIEGQPCNRSTCLEIFLRTQWPLLLQFYWRFLNQTCVQRIVSARTITSFLIVHHQSIILAPSSGKPDIPNADPLTKSEGGTVFPRCATDLTCTEWGIVVGMLCCFYSLPDIVALSQLDNNNLLKGIRLDEDTGPCSAGYSFMKMPERVGLAVKDGVFVDSTTCFTERKQSYIVQGWTQASANVSTPW